MKTIYLTFLGYYRNLQEHWASSIGRISRRNCRVGSWDWEGRVRGRNGRIGGGGGYIARNWGCNCMVHDVLIVGEGVRSHISSWQDTGAGDSEESEDGGKLKRMRKKGLIACNPSGQLNVLTILVNIVG